MADAVIGKSYLQVIPKLDTKPLGGGGTSAGKEFGAKFSKAFDGGLGDIGNVASKAFKAVAGAATVAAGAAATTIAAVGKQAFESYASYEQLSGGISKLFGTAGMSVEQFAAQQGASVDAVAGKFADLEKAQDLVMTNAQQAYKTAGMSANEYMENVSGFAAALTNSLGGDTVKAAEQADVAMRAISDNVNTFGSDMESVTNAYQGFAKGQYTMLDNLRLGYGGTKTEMERLIADANEWGAANGKASDLSIDSFSDVVTAIEQIQEKQQIAGTTAKEAGTTIEGSMNSAKAAWSNLLTEFGKSDGDISAAMDALVTSIVGDDSGSNNGVIGNVIPRIGIIVGNVMAELPGLIAATAPQIGSALLSAINTATSGMGTKVLNFLSPITDAVGQAFSGMGKWYQDNKTQIDDLVDSIGEFAGVLVENIGGAISTVAPILGDLASGALPLLSAAFDVLSGFVEGAVKFFEALAEGMQPLIDAVTPVVEVIGETLVQALEDLAEGLANTDFTEFAEIVGDAMQSVVDFVKGAIDAVVGFVDDVGKFLEDPIGTIQRGFESIMTSGDATNQSVSASFTAMERNIDNSTKGAGRSLDALNGKKLNDKNANATVRGNAVDGSAARNVGSAAGAISSLHSKTVDATVNGNATHSTIADNIWSIVNGIKNLTDKTVNVRTNTTVTRSEVATGGIRYHADGFIANRYGAGVPLDIVGEDGAEAIIPLTNKRYVRPFADTVAEQMLARMGGMGGVTVSVDYNAGESAEEMARDLAVTLDRLQRMGG